ncbi:MAG: hypothetical protein ACREI7_11420, partial [Myxococcota bacterium]
FWIPLFSILFCPILGAISFLVAFRLERSTARAAIVLIIFVVTLLDVVLLFAFSLDPGLRFGVMNLLILTQLLVSVLPFLAFVLLKTPPR